MSSSCTSDSEDDKIITTSIERPETLTRRREKETRKQQVAKQTGTSGEQIKKAFLKLPEFLNSSDNPAGWVFFHVENFIVDSVRLIRRCSKPDTKEFKKIAYACGVGFLLMGFIGYIVKLVFIPINNILVSE